MVDPTEDELRGINSLDDARAWAGVEGRLSRTLNAAFGDPVRVREVALIPRPIWDDTVENLTLQDEGDPLPPPRPPTPVEHARVESLRRICCIRAGRPVDHPGDTARPAAPAVPPAAFPPVGGGAPAAAGVPAPQARKLKLSAVLDPTLDAEIQALTDTEITDMYERYRQRFGDFPSTDADVSRDQLAALNQVIASGSVPFADFSIFGPHGQRLLRRQTFQSYTLNVSTGEWGRKEQPGPASFYDWYKAWRCYRTAMLLLHASEAERLDAYAEHIRGFVTQFGEEAWPFVCKADSRMRSEQLERLRRELHAHPALGYTAATPWSACYAAAIKDTEFWNKELTTPTTLFLARSKRATAEPEEDEGDVGGEPKRRKGRSNRTYKGDNHSKKDKAGLYTHNRRGVEICRLYNNGKCGTKQAQGKCKAKRSHQCNRCLVAKTERRKGRARVGKPDPQKLNKTHQPQEARGRRQDLRKHRLRRGSAKWRRPVGDKPRPVTRRRKSRPQRKKLRRRRRRKVPTRPRNLTRPAPLRPFRTLGGVWVPG